MPPEVKKHAPEQLAARGTLRKRRVAKFVRRFLTCFLTYGVRETSSRFAARGQNTSHAPEVKKHAAKQLAARGTS